MADGDTFRCYHKPMWPGVRAHPEGKLSETTIQVRWLILMRL